MKKLLKRIFILFLIVLMILPLTVFLSMAINSINIKPHENFFSKEIYLPSGSVTGFDDIMCAETPTIVSFWDAYGAYNVARYAYSVLYIYRFDEKLNLFSSLEIKSENEMFGNIVCDNEGNYYICWGNNDYYNKDYSNMKDFLSKNITVICIEKYDYNGNLVGDIKFNGADLSDSYGGTKYPFSAGTCAMAINNGTLACLYAREQYSGHQSAFRFYVNCDTMTLEDKSTANCSHSFGQACIATSDGGFMMANQGDAYPRGFLISQSHNFSRITFNFREGADRPYGYNETYAQLGGLAETDNTYILCASSERTLSLDVAPTKFNYASYSEARDLFIQILKKDYSDYSGSDIYYVEGETREATGERPKYAETDFFLSMGTKNYGVIWLTDYEDEFFVANPKIVSINDGRFVLLWEKRYYSAYELESSYYMIMHEDGTVLKEATPLGKICLPDNADVVYKDGSVYWSTYNSTGRIYVLHVDEHKFNQKITVSPSCAEVGNAEYVCSDCSLVWTPASNMQIPALGHTGEVISGKSATCTETGLTEGTKCSACGEITKAQTVIHATGHNPGAWVVKTPAKVGVKGLEQQKCTVCSVVLNERDIPALPEETTKPGKPTEKPPVKPTSKTGDANGDGKITAADARIILRISAKLEKTENYKQSLAVFDATGDGKITAADARKILRISAKLE